MEIDPQSEPLKVYWSSRMDSAHTFQNLDTDELVDHPDSNAILFTRLSPNGRGTSSNGGYTVHRDSSRASLFAAVRDECMALLENMQRSSHGEAGFHDTLQQLLNELVDHRLGHVRLWLELNTKRFPTTHQGLRELFQQLDEQAVEMKSAVELCPQTCGSCHLLCLQDRQHRDSHDCATNHRCPEPCEVSENHDDVVSCGFKYAICMLLSFVDRKFAPQGWSRRSTFM